MSYSIPAFPRTQSNPIADDAQSGMTLRDYFAGQVLMGLIAKDGIAAYKMIAPVAYDIADRMIQAREEECPPTF